MTGHATDTELAGGWRAGLEVQACTCDDINFVCRESFQDPARTPGRIYHKVYCLHLRDSYESRIKKKVRAALTLHSSDKQSQGVYRARFTTEWTFHWHVPLNSACSVHAAIEALGRRNLDHVLYSPVVGP